MVIGRYQKIKKMAKKPDIAWRIIKSALKLGEQNRWRELTLGDVAKSAKVSLADILEIYPSKTAIWDAFARRIDMQVAKAVKSSAADESKRDQLFEILMTRFDALAPHKSALKAILADSFPSDPITSLSGACSVLRAMAMSLELAGISSSGLKGRLKTKGLAAIYLRCLKVWLEDESADMAKTMAALDGSLARAGKLVQFLDGPRLGRRNLDDAQSA